ncbi:MAG: DUF6503 family protein [Cyclobacteriaceae bacterium]
MKYFFFLPALLLACSQPSKVLNEQTIIDYAIEAHGLQSLTGKKIAFDFREKHYTMLREDEKFTYTRSFQDSLGFVEDILVNSSDFTRLIDGTIFPLDEEWSDKYSNSVNSVLYFVQLPLTLNDPAAMKTYQGTVEIKGKTYHQIEVRFQEADGGKDFEDVFLYWFEKDSFTMDYFAYSYITDGGGVRFREAINRNSVSGIVFQDYINYKPEEKTTPLTELLSLFKDGKLIELSRIQNTAINVE